MLERIIQYKRQEIEELKNTLPNEQVFIPLQDRLSSSCLLKPSPSLRIIAEIKKASPVKGRLGNFSRPEDLARIYQDNGAAAISVISDQKFFQGHKESVGAVAAACPLPVLRKDFILDEIQLLESRLMQANMVLLIAALHSYKSLLRLCQKSRELGLEPLVEIHEQNELALLRDLPLRLVGVNNRNLKTFEVSLETSRLLADRIDPALVRVSESGIKSKKDMALLAACGYDAVLIGEALVTAIDPGAKLRELHDYREVLRP